MQNFPYKIPVIIYCRSPDKRVLWNRSDVLKHLTSWGTCKCGLQCPVDIDIVFSFNRNVPTGHELPSPTGSCAHVRRNGGVDVSTRDLCIELIQGACLPNILGYSRVTIG